MQQQTRGDTPEPNFIIKDLPSVLNWIIADQIFNDSLFCFNKYNWCFCTCIGKLYFLLLTPYRFVGNMDNFAGNVLD